MDPHSSDTTRNKNATRLRGDTQNFRIGSAIGNYVSGVPDIEEGFSTSQASPDVRIKVGICPKANPQAELASLSFLSPLETFY
jgi:hypothetical protein